ncbi:MAG: zinc ribbon domain-containing protein [Prevotellaceae bacterium]|jgi:hypothetical protein|nr:zinc ribbon domain-containing protein [Prevotellaceae bacterium]
MICKKCNFENDSAARFCENCGAALHGKNPVQTNKDLMKVIWGCIALLYIGFFVSGFNYRLKLILDFLSLVVLAAVWVLFFVKQIKLSFAITAALLSTYVFAGAYTIWWGGYITVFFIILFAAAATVLIYKYSFAENQKLL